MQILKFHGIVDKAMLERFQVFTNNLKADDHVLLHIRSLGGDSKFAIQIFNLINKYTKYGVTFYAVGYEQVHSYALVIFLACPFRAAYKETTFLIHQGKSIYNSIEDEQQAMDDFSRLVCSQTKYSVSELKKITHIGTYVSYEDAFKKCIINIEINKIIRKHTA